MIAMPNVNLHWGSSNVPCEFPDEMLDCFISNSWGVPSGLVLVFSSLLIIGWEVISKFRGRKH